MSAEKHATHLKENYGNIRSPVSYLGQKKIYDFYGGQLPMSRIRGILQQSDIYSIMKEEKTSKIFAPTISYFPSDIMQADLIYIDEFKETNSNMKYILCVIDVHTKFAYVEAIPDKTASVVLRALNLIFL